MQMQALVLSSILAANNFQLGRSSCFQRVRVHLAGLQNSLTGKLACYEKAGVSNQAQSVLVQALRSPPIRAHSRLQQLP